MEAFTSGSLDFSCVLHYIAPRRAEMRHICAQIAYLIEGLQFFLVYVFSRLGQ
jgi:hypothetical protein